MISGIPNALNEYVPGRVWLKDYPIRFAGCRFNARMTVIRLSDGRLLIHSPCQIDAVMKSEIEALGPVAFIIAPGNYHYRHVKSAQDAFVGAETHICPGIEKKDPKLTYSKVLGDEPDPAWAEDLDQVLVRGSRFIWEVVFFHRATKILILVDLIENYGDNTTKVSGILRFWWKVIFRMWNRPKPAPEYQIGWRNKAAARKCLERILTWDFDKIIIAHGDLIEEEAQRIARTAWKTVLDTGENEPAAKQTVGSYTPRKEDLLKDLECTFDLMKDTLVGQFGEKFTQELRENVRQEYRALIPDIPNIMGGRARMLNAFLLVIAQEVAAYKALNKLGKSPEDAWQLCHRALRLRLDKIPKWKIWLMRKFMFSKLVGMIMASRARRRQKGHFGEFEIEYLNSEGEDFDLGVNYLRCGHLRFAMEHGGEAFAPYICMSDIALSDALGWGLTRTQTLADGCDHCDFRMTDGAVTRITSKTPDVQKAIERIRTEEMNRYCD